jgi:hypothetical protein
VTVCGSVDWARDDAGDRNALKKNAKAHIARMDMHSPQFRIRRVEHTNETKSTSGEILWRMESLLSPGS